MEWALLAGHVLKRGTDKLKAEHSRQLAWFKEAYENKESIFDPSGEIRRFYSRKRD